MSSRHGFRQGRALFARNKIKTGTSAAILRWVILGLVSLLSTFLTPVFAQTDEAASVKVGESNLTPSVRLDFLQTNNAFLNSSTQSGATNQANTQEPRDATALVISPRVDWQADRRLLSLTGIYEGEYASYSEDALSYADHSLRAIANADLSTRNRLRFSAAFDFGHQALGTFFTRGEANENAEQVEFVSTNVRASYIYGAEKARGNFQVGLNVLSNAYQNRSDVTEGWGYTALRPFGQFSLRVSADTRAIATVRFSNFAYGISSRDRNDLSLLAGLRFAATGKLGGQFQLGASSTSFEAANREDDDSLVVEAELFYRPTTFSRFELTGERALEDNAGNLTIADTAELNWRHDWSSRFFHVADLSYRSEECPTSGSINRASGAFEMNLVLRRWLHIGASFKGESREDSQCTGATFDNINLDYESQIVGAHIRATL